MAKVFIIGLGPGDIGSLTLDAVEKITNGSRVYLRTEKHPTVKYLVEKQIEYTSYDFIYETEEEFSDVYEKISEDLIQNAKKYDIINYCVPGNPLVAEKTVSLLIEKEKQKRVEIEIISGLSFIEPMIHSLSVDPIDGLKIVDGLDISNQTIDINTDNLITQVYNRMRASDLKLELMEMYGDEYKVYVVKSAGIEDEEKKVKIPLYELDRIEWIDSLTSIYIPKMDKNKKMRYDMFDLLSIMSKLRSEDGCPWDQAQTHKSLREYVLEEAYEVVDAIDSDDIDSLIEELGDLLLQVVFHSQIGKDDGYFNFYDVTTSICEKLIRRHPSEAKQNWNDIKAKEKNISTYTDRMKSIPKGLPGLMKSVKVQNRAKDIGFDWSDFKGALSKVEEELLEVKVEIENSNLDKLEEEIGDLIFSIVNLSRFFDINPEVALNITINKFINRFEFMEKQCIRNDKDMKDLTLEELDSYWNQAKIN